MPPFRVNEVIWAKIRGYPNWPARVLDPADGASVKVTRRKNMYFVRFLSADEGKQTVSWVPEDELFDFSEKLAEMRLAAEMKGGKTYLDLRKCIEKAVEAHKQYLQDIERNPEMALHLALPAPSEGGSTTDVQPAKGRAKTPKNATGQKQQPVRSPVTPKPSKVIRSHKKQAKTEPEAEEATPLGKGTRVKSVPRKMQAGNYETSPQRTPGQDLTATASAGNTGVTGKRVPKKRVMPDDGYEQSNHQSASKKEKTASKVSTPFKSPVAGSAAKSEVKTKPSTIEHSIGSQATIKQAREISVGFIGLEDERAIYAAKQLLSKGVTVRVWARTSVLAKDLEYSGAERITEADKIFEETDVVFLTATAGVHDLNALLNGADHLARKIRPQGKNKIKGVCVFSSMSKEDSVATARKVEPKNIEYMECGWIGSSGNQLSLVTCRSRRLYDRCRPVLDLCCGDGKSHFLGEDFGLALAAAATVGAFESIVLAGLVETGYLAQNSGFSLDLLMPILQQRGHLMEGDSLETRARHILSFSRENDKSSQSAISACQEQSSVARDAVRLANPVVGTPSIIPLTSCSRDLFQTNFISYRYKRDLEDDQEITSSDTDDQPPPRLEIDEETSKQEKKTPSNSEPASKESNHVGKSEADGGKGEKFGADDTMDEDETEDAEAVVNGDSSMEHTAEALEAEQTLDSSTGSLILG